MRSLRLRAARLGTRAWLALLPIPAIGFLAYEWEKEVAVQTASQVGAGPDPARPTLTPTPTARAPTCRARTRRSRGGDASVDRDDDAITAGSWIPVEAAGPASDLIVEAAREHATYTTAFSGPGKVRLCVDRGNEAWLASGTVVAPAPGTAPSGSEQWIVVAGGAVRYTDARLVLSARALGATDAGLDATSTLTVEAGRAFVWTDDVLERGASAAPTPDGLPAAVDGWTRLDGPASAALRLPLAASPEALARAGVDSCVRRSKGALAASVASQNGGGRGSGTPGAQLDRGLLLARVAARMHARAACAVASLRVAMLEPTAQEDLARLLATADTEWRSIPNGLPARRTR